MNSDVINIKREDVVKKSETLLKSRFRLTPIALKLISALITTIQDSDKKDKEYIFRVKNFSELMGYSSKKIYEVLDEVTEELLSKPIKFPRDKGKGFKKFNWVSKAEYRYGEGTIVFRVDQDLRPYLIEAKEKYLKYRIHNILRLKSFYSIRLYEIFKDILNSEIRYSKCNKVSRKMSICWLRETLDIPNSYRYNDIKRVLDKSQKQLEQFTDISFSYLEEKEGRKVSFLIIEIRKSKEDYIFGTLEQFVQFIKTKYKGKNIPGTKYRISRKLYLTNKEDKAFSAEDSMDIFQNLLNKFTSEESFKNLFN